MGQNEQLFRKGIEFLNQQDGQGYRTMLAPDAEYLNPQGVYHGRDEVAASFEPEWRAFSDGRHEIVSLTETETGVAAECRWTGTHDGPLATPMGEFPATGRKLDLTYAIWVDTEAGLATSIRVYFDAMGYAMQLGLIPAPQTA